MFDSFITDLSDLGIDLNEFNREITSGLNFERLQVMAKDHMQAEVRTQRNPGVDGFGYCSLEVPEQAYFDWAIRHPGIWQNDRRYIEKKNPQWVRKYQPKPQSGWMPTLDRTDGGLFIGSKYGGLAA